MAVFLINICKFNGCGITFPSLGDLIQHIEDTHIDYDPKVIEQKEQAQPACLPLSYVLRFITDAARKENSFLGSSGADLKRKLAIKHHSYSMSSSNRSNTPTGSELDEDEMVVSESEDSNDSWTTEEFSSEFIMRYGSRHSGSNGSGGNEKPFACPVPGCKKRYKNVNGIKYHSKNGHKKDGKVRKGYKCHCGKSYKTAQGLKSHALLAHNSSAADILSNTTSNVLASNGSGGGGGRSASPSQSAGSLSPSSISNLSGSSGSCSNLNNQQIMNNSSSTQSQPPSSSQPTATHHHMSSSSNTNSLTASNLMRNNIGLISIKTSNKSNLIAANVTANKILKLTTTTATSAIPESVVQQHETNKLKFETSAKMSLPGLVNLGILTPSSSPKIQQHSYQQQQQQQNILNCNNSNSNHENLPLTPMSPNINKLAATTSAMQTSSATAAVGFHSGGNNDTLTTDET